MKPLALLFAFITGLGQPERVASITVHGNTLTEDAEIVRLAGIQLGMAVDPGTPEAVASRLRASRRFASVEVLKRYASIADLSQVMLVIIVDEGPVQIRQEGDAVRIVKARRTRAMFLPIVSYEDGYGFSYGVRVAFPGVVGSQSRATVPLTWGAEKQAGVELEKRFPRKAPVSRVVAAGVLVSRRNPFFDEPDDRRRASIRVERDLAPAIRVAGLAAFEHVSFVDGAYLAGTAGANLVVDTRLDPWLPRHAVYTRVAWDHMVFADASANRSTLDARGYVGLLGQTILVGRVLRESSDRTLPASFRPLLGSMQNLRGFRAGTAIGDTLVAGSVELRAPLSSPLSVGRFGVDAFVDVGTIYGTSERLSDQRFRQGVGAGVWLSAAIVRMNVGVARGIGAGFRGHFSTSVLF